MGAIVFFGASCSNIIFFSTETSFSGLKCFQNIFFCPCQRQNFFYSIKVADRMFYPKKSHSPPPSLPLQGKWTVPNYFYSFSKLIYMYSKFAYRELTSIISQEDERSVSVRGLLENLENNILTIIFTFNYHF